MEFNVNKDDFKYFINGLYQAKGTSGVYFPKANSLRVVCFSY